MSDEFLKKVGFSIKKKRLEQELTLQELELRSGVYKSTINRIENGQVKKLPIDKLCALSEALDVSVQCFFNGDDYHDIMSHITDVDVKESISRLILSLAKFQGYD